MTLLQQIKAYIQERHIVSLLDLKREFGTDTDVLRDMLNIWIKKGQLRSMQKTPACGTRCTNCDPLFTEIYEWQGGRALTNDKVTKKPVIEIIHLSD